MIVIPALDLRRGVCVQAAAGAAPSTGIRSAEPLEVAHAWERAGFHRLHVMELRTEADALSADPGATVRDLLGEVPLLIQVGGTIQSGDQVDQLIGDGAGFVILGPRALLEPEWLAGTASSFPHRLIVVSRLHGRFVEPGGGARRSLLDLIDDLNAVPIGGLLLAPDYRADAITSEDLPVLEDAADASEHPLLVAGGVRRAHDLRSLHDRGVAGAIVGSALYSGELDPRSIAEEFAE